MKWIREINLVIIGIPDVIETVLGHHLTNYDYKTSYIFFGIYVTIYKLEYVFADLVTSFRLADDISCNKADFRLAPSKWESSLQINAASHCLCANLESSMCVLAAVPGLTSESAFDLKVATWSRPSCHDRM